ncbi:uncharacterized protein [Argopecten irradians]|uniref:uncharacterized protein n=1 Tax=Argopecten irradians TaxID=31199 RepID=UPI003714D766
MGCNNTKSEADTQKRRFIFFWRRQNKVVAINIPVQDNSGISLDYESSNTRRKTKQTVLMQLKAEGVEPRKGNGGVAFVVEIGGPKGGPSASIVPGAPEYSSYSVGAYRAGTDCPPRRLPPIDKAALDKKQERARRNRERKTAERRAKWARKYARVQAGMKSPRTDG